MQSRSEGPEHENLIEAPESELARGSFDLRAKRAKKPGQTKFYLMLAGLLLVMLVGLITVWSVVLNGATSKEDVDESKAVFDAALQRDEAADDSLDKIQERKRLQMLKERAEKAEQERLAKAEQEAKTESSQASSKDQTATSATKAQAQNQAQGPERGKPSAAQRRLAGGVVALSAASGRGSSTAAKSDEEQQDEPAPGGSDSASLSNLGGTRFASTKAKLAPDGTYLLAHNTYARCALYTEIITDNPGLIECRLTDPLYSANGQTVLADAGARLFGEQRTTVKSGQQRVFTAWTELEANNGSDSSVRVRLDSLGAGPMGASGTQAWIDNHWLERTGGALMLSLFQDVMAGISNATQKSSKDGYTVNNTEQNVESMGEKVLDSTINIPPTAYVLPGTVMTVIVARDIDFSPVYLNR